MFVDVQRAAALQHGIVRLEVVGVHDCHEEAKKKNQNQRDAQVNMDGIVMEDNLQADAKTPFQMPWS